MTGITLYSATATGHRSCGGCTLCCKLVPVSEIAKKAGERCEHQRQHGCKIYDHAPRSCQMWSCLWLIDDDTRDLSRPDRAHYVIDPAPDFVTLQYEGETVTMPVLQVWCDPRHPTAHRDPALRAYIERRGTLALIRYNSADAFVLVPPHMSDGQWIERPANNSGQEHSKAEIAEALRDAYS